MKTKPLLASRVGLSLCVGGLWLLAAGCGSESAPAGVNVPECVLPLDCPEGFVCELGLCVAENINQDGVSFDAADDDAGDAAPDSGDADAIDEDPDAIVVADADADVQGDVRDEPDGPPDAGDEDGDANGDVTPDADADTSDTALPPAPFVVATVQVSQDRGIRTTGGYSGSANGIIDTQEEFDLRLTVRHVGTETYDAIRLFLTTGSDAVELPVDITSRLTDFSPGSERTLGPFRIAVSTLNDGDSLLLGLTPEPALRLDTVDVPLRVRDARVDVTGITFDDTAGGNGNGIPDRGETVTVRFTVANAGSATYPPSFLEDDPFGLLWTNPTVNIAVGTSTPAVASLVPTSVDLARTIGVGESLTDPVEATLRVEDTAADGAELCARITVNGLSDGVVRYNRVAFGCTRVTFGTIEACEDGDLDGFGFGSLCDGPDCNDSDDSIFPGAVEICDDVDNDCDGVLDDGVEGPWWADTDGDTWGAGDPVIYCAGAEPAGTVPRSGDCDDSRATVSPSAAEVCDGADNDCDLVSDEGVTGTWYRDSDSDGFGDPADPASFCPDAVPPGFVANDDDCGPTEGAVNPSAPEICDGRDNDCDLDADELSAPVYADRDGDGFGTTTGARLTCPPDGEAWVGNNTDCNDSDGGIYPGAAELCDTVNNDCDGSIDEGFNLSTDSLNCGACGNVCESFTRCTARVCVPFCEDRDGDGAFGAGRCARANEDCNDENNTVFPRATDVCDNGTDENCDGLDRVCPVACDPLSQNCSRADARCAVETGTAVCAAIGPRLVSQTCSRTVAAEFCGEGAVCVAWDNPAQDTCHEFCANDGDCENFNRICSVSLTGAGGVPLADFCEDARTCNPLAQDCGAGSKCDSYRDTRSPDLTTFRCLANGTLPAGANCSTAGSCVAGTVCVGAGPDQFFCRPFCTVGTSSCVTGTCGGIIGWPSNVGACLP